LAFITTRVMVYGHYKAICKTFFHNKIYYKWYHRVVIKRCNIYLRGPVSGIGETVVLVLLSSTSPDCVLAVSLFSERRETNTIDFYISSESLAMSDIKPLTLTSETGVTEVLSLFDHDPVANILLMSMHIYKYICICKTWYGMI
jgi:hypothetical protein